MKSKFLITVVLVMMLFSTLSVTAYGAPSTVVNFTYSPKIFSTSGGTCTFKFTVNNKNDTCSITRITLNAIGKQSATYNVIAPNSSKSITLHMIIPGSELDKTNNVSIEVYYSACSLTETIYNSTFRITTKLDVIYSTNKSISPEQTIYYVGDTVQMVDNFKNRETSNASSCSVEYYKKVNGTKTIDDQSHHLGTISAGASKDFTYSYTFLPDDVGEVEIASSIEFTYQGTKYDEYCVAHKFIVEERPETESTPTPAVEAEVTAAPTVEPTSTPLPDAKANLTVKPVNDEINSGDEVIFAVDVANIGVVPIDVIEVYDNDKLITTFTNVGVGDTARYMYTVSIDKTTAFNFSIKMDSNGKKLNAFADIVTIEVNDSEEAEVHNAAADDNESSVLFDMKNMNILTLAAIVIGTVFIVTLIVVIGVLIVRAGRK